MVSMGDDQRTFEAMGRDYGVRFGQIHGRTWTSAGLIPELDYEATKRSEPVSSAPLHSAREEDASASFLQKSS